ncbi:MAG: ADP-ribosylglycohydrolase family protein [Clostridia bacterium]|nr:ADP-ribosylglycohydrolase family protein [Clostridia bacterium]
MSKKRARPAPELTARPGFYAHELDIELLQCRDEGLDLRPYEDLIRAVAALEPDENREKLADTVYDMILGAKKLRGYKYIEPSDREGIFALCEGGYTEKTPGTDLKKRIFGAWYGRIAGCLLGKPLEGIRTDELIPLLKETGNYPMSRWPLNEEMTDDLVKKYRFKLQGKCYIDNIDRVPADDDTNYTVLAQMVIDRYGRDFTPDDIVSSWAALQPQNAYFTAEYAAYLNFVRGFRPPHTATYKNHYREWIGAQIRADYFGYICPGRPDLAADMAWRDASVSHVKNGIYGEMFVAAMLARAAVCDDIEEVIRCGMAYIPKTARLYERLAYVVDAYKAGVPSEEVYAQIHREFDEHTGYGWCHVIPNAMIVASSLLYGEKDYGRSVCLAVQTGFDTDCNGATVGSVLGMLIGLDRIGAQWTAPLRGTLETGIVKAGVKKIDALAERTLEHINGSGTHDYFGWNFKNSLPFDNDAVKAEDPANENNALPEAEKICCP